LPIQAKLTVGAPDDEYEQEADAVADRVMRMPAADSAIDEETQAPAVQRVCDACEDELQRQAEEDEEEEEEEEEPVQAKSQAGKDAHTGGDAHTAVSNVRGGEPLSDGMRAYFEPRMGYDFADVRVHTGTQANEVSRSINAKAFTHGRDIAFADGHFQPEAENGRHLLAHELTHVVQQRRGIHRVVQRDMDTRIHQVYPNASRYDQRIFFDYNSSRIPSTEIAKLNSLGTRYAGKEVKLFGRASEEGDAAHNNLLIGRRIAVVRGALERRGVSVYDTESRFSDAVGQLDYRFQRSVEVVVRPPATADNPTPEASTGQDPCSRPNSELAIGDELTGCQREFYSVWPRAFIATVTAYLRLMRTDPDSQRDNLLSTLFTGVDPAIVKNHVKNLMLQVARAPLVMSCRSTCDDRCTRGMSNAGTGSSARLNICPRAYQGTPDRHHNTLGLVHESAHGTSGLAATDISYGPTRRFEFLPPSESVRNTDSYTYLVLMLGDPGRSWSYGPASADTTPGLDATTESPHARVAVAYMEDWLNYGAFDTGLTYDFIGRSLAAWSTGRTNDSLGTNMMEKLGDDFALSKPSVAPHSEQEDRHHMASMHDRYTRMYHTIYHRPVEIAPTSEGREGWESQRGLPGAGQKLSVPPSFFGLGLKGRIMFMIELLARALRDVSAAFAKKYADGADEIRKYRGLGP
jgi:hypothetical protein